MLRREAAHPLRFTVQTDLSLKRGAAMNNIKSTCERTTPDLLFIPAQLIRGTNTK